MQSIYNESTQRLLRAIAALRTEEECRAFFEDLCTIKELQDMTQRFDTAILLRQGLSYQKIAEQAGISTATITRVNRSLSYGSGGYQVAFDRLKEEGESI